MLCAWQQCRGAVRHGPVSGLFSEGGLRPLLRTSTSAARRALRLPSAVAAVRSFTSSACGARRPASAARSARVPALAVRVVWCGGRSGGHSSQAAYSTNTAPVVWFSTRSASSRPSPRAGRDARRPGKPSVAAKDESRTAAAKRARQAAFNVFHKEARGEKALEDDDDLLVLYSADNQMRRSYKFSGMIVVLTQVYMIILAVLILFVSAPAADAKAKEKAEAGEEEMDFLRSPLGIRLLGTAGLLFVSAAYFFASRQSTSTLLSLVLRRTDNVVHVRTFPNLADYPKRNCFALSWLPEMGKSRLSVESHRLESRLNLVVSGDGENEERKLVMQKRFLRHPDVWKDKLHYDIDSAQSSKV